jgi:hypothetical protein
MKKILILLMSMAIFSLAFSKNIYLVIPDGATDVSYYAVDSNGDKLTVSETSKSGKYHGDEDLNLVTLSIQSSDIIKLVAGYKLDDEYYFMVSSDADKDTIKNKIESADSPFDVFEGVTTFGSYSNYPGIKVKDDVRLSLIAVEQTNFENTEILVLENGTVEVSGKANFSPSNSDNNELAFSYLDDSEEVEEAEFKSDADIFEFDKGNKPTESSPLVIENVKKLYFRVKNNSDNTLTIDGMKVEKNTLVDKYGDMTLKFYNTSYKNGKANGKWWLVAEGDMNGGDGDIIVLIEDTGTVASSGIDVDSKVKAKSRKRDTRLETSIIDSENFVIENIKE